MLSWIKNARKQIPPEQAAILDNATLTGLRAEEAIESIKRLQNPAERKLYVNEEKRTLEHFKFPIIFIRRTKKAYITILTDEIVKAAEQARQAACYSTLRDHLFRRKFEVHVKYCRKVFGTFMKMHGVESDFVDLLQGRKPKSVFGKHYYRPDWEERSQEIRSLIKQLYLEINGYNNAISQRKNQIMPSEKKPHHPEQGQRPTGPMQPIRDLSYYIPGSLK